VSNFESRGSLAVSIANHVSEQARDVAAMKLLSMTFTINHSKTQVFREDARKNFLLSSQT
jgi:hypothetical protein